MVLVEEAADITTGVARAASTQASPTERNEHTILPAYTEMFLPPVDGHFEMGPLLRQDQRDDPGRFIRGPPQYYSRTTRSVIEKKEREDEELRQALSEGRI